ncbi:bi-domain-containing oxidoreductase [Muriicola sp. Z0-33]|uniref:bi-domain-containing oxidoreductase n=1 Tax=Muriicola sp. Z0-33 TaxID=2816957 RepID=UPI0022383B90|nr:bi-domain-containing oxidoreductase [Muriicola sp. Z0-33]MCW5517990.1 Gfo/Idh/MocA family oxidoreductase [Muriicola sp. Z0-33]
MLQLTQKLNNGEMQVQEVPAPQLGKGMVLVKNHYSLISAGTESSTVKAARKNLIGKAKERPQQVKQVIDTLIQQGPVQTYRAVSKKLEAYSTLGYSSAGEIIEVGEGVTEFSRGDWVACAGVGYAVHAEIIAVPINLVVKLNNKASLKNAAYNTLGAIAMQGVRQADLRLGETCAVIGLGLLGHLTCLMLKASGLRVIGIDVNSSAVESARSHCTDLALNRNSKGIEDQIHQFTDGIGVDSVIIAAGTESLDPINFAGVIARKKGKVVILGVVPTGFERYPHWYRKELELKMSCSYGPGRYDNNYEEKGIDYPVAYVRWTEKRNMLAFQQLIYSGTINIDYLTTHEIDFNEAPDAYDMILNNSEPYMGIILKYDIEKKQRLFQKISTNKPSPIGKVNIAFIGAGSYAQGNLLPNIPKNKQVTRKGILTNTGVTSKRVAERFGFDYCTSDEKDILQNDEVNTVFIATRHDSHAEYVLKSLKNNKNVFVEKPLCISPDELSQITDQYNGKQHLLVGFNRRFSPLSVELKKKMGKGPMSMNYRINAGKLPNDSWLQDMELGGGRIIGEVCHFIDYLTWMNGSLPIGIFANALPDAENNNDTLSIQLTFANGSIGVVSYYANGPKTLPKEYIEVFNSGSAGILNNFKELKIFGKKKFKKKLFNQDKGQAKMVDEFICSIKNGTPSPISFEEIISVSKASFAVLESLKTGALVKI